MFCEKKENDRHLPSHSYLLRHNSEELESEGGDEYWGGPVVPHEWKTGVYLPRDTQRGEAKNILHWNLKSASLHILPPLSLLLKAGILSSVCCSMLWGCLPSQTLSFIFTEQLI